ncbi:MAG: hypothetical protein ACR2PS_09855 [Pseudomonadales bacterium]
MVAARSTKTGRKKTPAKKSKAKKAPTAKTSDQKENRSAPSLFEQIVGYTGKVTSGALDIAKATTAIPLMFTDNWFKESYMKTLDPETLKAMAEAGSFLQDARQVAGLNLQDLAEAVGLADTELLEEVEQGRATLPFDMILRIASLTARHDPIPFILKFVRTYNPALANTLDEWGVMALPRQYERERTFINIFRKHDELRAMSEEEFERFITYQESATAFSLEVMGAEKAVAKSKKTAKQKSATKAKRRGSGK